MTRRDQTKVDTSDEEDDHRVEERNGYSPATHQRIYAHPRHLKMDESEESEEEDQSNEVIEIDSDDSQDGMNLSNNQSSQAKNEQNNNQDSDRESTSSDIVVVSDDFQKFNEEIERLSRIHREVELPPEDKVSIKNFRIHKLLGTGAYGKVFLVEKLDGIDKGHLYAMKVLEKNKVTQKKKTTEHTRTEREVLEKVIDCPFLATLYYAFQTAEKLYLVMEFVQGGELFSHLYKSEHFGEDQVRFYIAEIIVALEQLHRLNIIYRDIKLENILLDADGHIIITDFGLSKELTDNARAMSYCGTIEYMAPEIVNPNGIGHDLNVDWWSVGVLIIELLSGQSPFSREGEDSNQQLISERIQRQAPNIPPSIGKDAKDLILKLLEKDPTKRLGYKRDADELKKHKFFRGIKWDILTEKRYNAPMKPALKNKFDVSQFSEDFTSQPAVDGPAESGPLTAPNGKNFFKGYSFVAPKFIMKREPEVNSQLNEMSITDHPPEMNRPNLKDVLSVASRNKSTFFEKYELFEDKSPIGDGTYSLCMKCRSTSSKKEFAVKILKIDHDASQEIEALQKCQDHRNIVKMVEVLHDKHFKYIVFELLSGGELFSRIQKSGFLAEPIAHSYFKQIVEAVKYMHSKGIIHKDLKPENILFVDESDNSEELRIVDFGFAQKSSSEESPPCFTLDYAAPESLVRGETKASRDLWSLGVILYTMLVGNTPFKPTTTNTTAAQDERNFRMQITENIRNGFYNKENIRWDQITDEARDLIIKLIRVNESERISLEEVLHHPWMMKNCNNGYGKDSSMRRTDSEETIVEEDDAIVINDDDFRNENRDETRSIDDSSSGIVMSDRNEGSSVSHEEIDPSGHILFENNDEEMASIALIEEQIEPENLSLKEIGNAEKNEEKVIDDEPTVLVQPEVISVNDNEDDEEDEPIPIKTASKSKSRTPKKGRTRATRQKATTQEPLEIAPLDLHTPKIQDETNPGLNLIVEAKEEFNGFNLTKIEDDDNFPFFGFVRDLKSDLISKTLLMFSVKENVAVGSKKVLSKGKTRRPNRKNNKKTVQKQIEVTNMLPISTNVQKPTPAKRSRAAKPEIAPTRTSTRPLRACRALKLVEKAAEKQKALDKKLANESLKLAAQQNRAPKRAAAKIENEIPVKRSRRIIKEEPIEVQSVIQFVQINETVKKPRSRKKKNEETLPPPPPPPADPKPTHKRAPKRKAVEVEAPKKVVEKKKKPMDIKKEMVEYSNNVRITRKRQRLNDIASTASSSFSQPNIPSIERLNPRGRIIKAEKSSIEVISMFPRTTVSSTSSELILSPRFKERINSIKTSYVDNRAQPSLIPSRFAKPEPVEFSTINISSQPLRTQYR